MMAEWKEGYPTEVGFYWMLWDCREWGGGLEVLMAWLFPDGDHMRVAFVSDEPDHDMEAVKRKCLKYVPILFPATPSGAVMIYGRGGLSIE